MSELNKHLVRKDDKKEDKVYCCVREHNICRIIYIKSCLYTIYLHDDDIFPKFKIYLYKKNNYFGIVIQVITNIFS